MTIQKIRSSRVTSITADTFIAEKGMLFFNEALGDLRLGDGITAGGIPLSVNGNGSYDLPAATNSTLGGVKIGENILFNNGVISVSNNYHDLVNKPVIPYDISQLTDTSAILQHLISVQHMDGGGPTSIYGGTTAFDGGYI